MYVYDQVYKTNQIVELDSSDPLVNTRNDLHGDSRGVNVIRIKAIT